MPDKLDPLLLDLFEAKRTSLSGDEFVAALLADIERRQRASRCWLLLLGMVFALALAWQLPGLLRATAAAVHTVSAQSQDYAPLLISPLGWAMSMLVGLGVMLRIMPRRL